MAASFCNQAKKSQALNLIYYQNTKEGGEECLLFRPLHDMDGYSLLQYSPPGSSEWHGWSSLISSQQPCEVN